MSNPYASPSFDPKQFQDYPSHFPPPQNTGFGWVQQVRVVAILNCVQGGLECLMGIFMGGMGVFLSYMLQAERNNPNFRNNNQPPPGMEWVFGGVYLAIGVVLLLAGILRLYAGIRNFGYRGRILGIVSMVCGMISVFSCYCAPTGIAMIIYGLIVFLNPAVQAAFVLGEQGTPSDAILNSFLPYPPPNYGQPANFGQSQTPGQSPFEPPPSPPPA
jgi:hypothetical protein